MIRPTQTEIEYALPFSHVGLEAIAQVGGKNASLGELIAALAPVGVRVPDGFAITAGAFRLHLAQAGLDRTIYDELDRLDLRDILALGTVARSIRERIAAAPLPAPVADQLDAAYRTLSAGYGEEATDVAVRSSATAEDLPSASFAGQQETYLNVRGHDALDRAVRSCFASLFTDRAIVYRAQNGFRHRDVALSVGVQKMVRSDLGSAGVIFTLDTESGFRDVVLVTGAWGLGETVVQGRVRPDEFWVHKPTLRNGHRSIIRREIAEKAVKLVYAEGGAKAVQEVRVPGRDRLRPVLHDDDILTLARWSLAIEEHYSRHAGRPTPMDIEWARDGRSGELFIVQARPETVHSQRTRPVLELWRRRGEGKVLITGRSVGGGVASGPVRVILDTSELAAFQDGEVLVAPMTDPDWEPVLKRSGGGGHRRRGPHLPRGDRLPRARHPMRRGHGGGHSDAGRRSPRDRLLRGGGGGKGVRRGGAVRSDRDRPRDAPETARAAHAQPGQPGSGIPARAAAERRRGPGAHRVRDLELDRHPSHGAAAPRATQGPRRAGRACAGVAGYRVRAEFFTSRLATGVAQIAAAFHPRPVIVRFSDFKTNEYAGLLGGAPFEPTESNPMIGFRGASRYYDDRYREAFALECAAIRRVREEMGLTNVKVMIPFCRTLEEGRRVIAELDRNGLRRGEHGLEVYVMCEIPNNVILADEFAELFDGFSIGSNDLTQLTLGVDRDSELLAHLFDERDPGVKRLIRMVVEAAHRQGRKVGICGQAPSDFPDFAEFLAEIGIDSISLNPDSLAKVAERLAVRPAAAPALAVLAGVVV